jgi:hypothetical protein
VLFRSKPPVRTDGERAMLTAVLDWYRDGVLLKVEGVSPAHAAAKPLRSETSIAGVVKHLALVEDTWFSHRFAGHPEPAPWAGVPWDDDRAVHPATGEVLTLRWVLVQHLEETARHLGHLDVLGELLDGTTGDQGPATPTADLGGCPVRRGPGGMLRP